MPRIRTLFSGLLALISLGLSVTPSAAQTEKRIALVIGNAAYQAGGALNTPANDAGLIAQTLQAAGFDVAGAAHCVLASRVRAHLGYRITGFAVFEISLGTKWIGTLKQIAPSLKRVTTCGGRRPLPATNRRKVIVATNHIREPSTCRLPQSVWNPRYVRSWPELT